MLESIKTTQLQKFVLTSDVSSEDFKAAAYGRASHEANLRDELFEKVSFISPS